MLQPTFEHYMQIEGEEAERLFRIGMERAGYFAFYRFVEDFRAGLRAYSDEDIAKFRECLARGERLFPSPERFSPSWNGLWSQFAAIFRVKNAAMAKIPPATREGEWQILIDNPFTTQPVVCYPGLAFNDAAYMYGYFSLELKPNEQLRLQKVIDLLAVNGDPEASLFWDE